MNWIKARAAAIGHALVRWGQDPLYVAIYDDPEIPGDLKHSYFLFDSQMKGDPFTLDDAVDQLIKAAETLGLKNAKLCIVLGPITEDDDA